MTHTTEELERLKDAYAEAKETYNVNRSAANLETATVAYRHYARAAVNALPELLEENEKLREALRLFMGAATPVSTEIDPRGYVWSLGYLDQARTALKETGQ